MRIMNNKRKNLNYRYVGTLNRMLNKLLLFLMGLDEHLHSYDSPSADLFEAEPLARRQMMFRDLGIIDVLVKICFFPLRLHNIALTTRTQTIITLKETMSLTYDCLRNGIAEYRPNELYASQWLGLFIEDTFKNNSNVLEKAESTLKELIDNNEKILKNRIDREIILKFVMFLARVRSAHPGPRLEVHRPAERADRLQRRAHRGEPAQADRLHPPGPEAQRQDHHLPAPEVRRQDHGHLQQRDELRLHLHREPQELQPEKRRLQNLQLCGQPGEVLGQPLRRQQLPGDRNPAEAIPVRDLRQGRHQLRALQRTQDLLRRPPAQAVVRVRHEVEAGEEPLLLQGLGQARDRPARLRRPAGQPARRPGARDWAGAAPQVSPENHQRALVLHRHLSEGHAAALESEHVQPLGPAVPPDHAAADRRPARRGRAEGARDRRADPSGHRHALRGPQLLARPEPQRPAGPGRRGVLQVQGPPDRHLPAHRPLRLQHLRPRPLRGGPERNPCSTRAPSRLCAPRLAVAARCGARAPPAAVAPGVPDAQVAGRAAGSGLAERGGALAGGPAAGAVQGQDGEPGGRLAAAAGAEDPGLRAGDPGRALADELPHEEVCERGHGAQDKDPAAGARHILQGGRAAGLPPQDAAGQERPGARALRSLLPPRAHARQQARQDAHGPQEGRRRPPRPAAGLPAQQRPGRVRGSGRLA